MLKIEVIKFEAMDVITASVAAPDVDAPEEAKCTCSANDRHYYFKDWSNDSLYYDHGDCTYEGEHNCVKYEVVN